MSSSCISSGGGRAYGFELEIVTKSASSTCSILSHSSSSSPSSTISESSNSPIAISTRKPRTPRKRPNQTYNEAAALLSTACPNIFSTKHLPRKGTPKFTKQQPQPSHTYFFPDPSTELLLIENLEKPGSRIEPKQYNYISPKVDDFRGDLLLDDDFDTESMLDEEMGEGIDSIMGLNSNVGIEDNIEKVGASNNYYNGGNNVTCYGYPIGGFGLNYDFGFGFGIRSSGVMRTVRKVEEERNWWRFPTVEVSNVANPKSAKRVPKNKKVERPAAETAAVVVPVVEELKRSESETGQGGSGQRLLLKLNYDSVLNAWSDKGSPLPEEISGSESPGGNDIHAKLAEIDLFSENGGLREASVMRYKEKRRTRLFSKKIRYQVRKVNADRRPRMKGRFVRSPNSPISGEG